MQPWFPLLMLLGVALAVGCQPNEISENADTDLSSNCGYFEGDVVASWDNDGRRMTLREDFSYVDPHDRRWTAPAGSVVDGASIPAAFWTFIGGPFEGQYRKASVVHDVGCHEKTARWEDVHRMFYEACVCGGVDLQTAKLLYYAVYHYGPRWEVVVETVVETHLDAQGQPVVEPVQRKRLEYTNPLPPTTDEVQQVVELIEDENPTRAVLEETTKEVLRRRPRRGKNYHRDNPLERPASDAATPSSLTPPVNRFTTPLSDSQPGGSSSRNSWRLNGHHSPSSEVDQPTQYRQTERQAGQPNNARRGRTFDPSSVPEMTEQEKQWLVQNVRAYLVNQQLNVPDEFGLERMQEGYRVELRYYVRNEQNEPIGYSANPPTARVATNGQVLDIR